MQRVLMGLTSTHGIDTCGRERKEAGVGEGKAEQ